ncbi:glutathione S-transferase N-terminal domain-containing protein [Paracoccus rhizosphaerae]|uniref:glutathione S-transferase N-terminal domain-containing protein n=1 Tax=Paracoccus rhizosphaerae TaxID=1133347 RepID=UPI0038999E1C
MRSPAESSQQPAPIRKASSSASSVSGRGDDILTLYGVPPTRAIRPIWLLNELDLVCRIENILPFDAESVRAVKALNPIGKIPYLVDGNLTI